MNLSLSKITSILNAKFIGTNENQDIEHISIDSRSLQNGVNTLFFALIGPNNNGHIYIEELIDKGVQNFVVTSIPENLKDKANFLLVENSI